MAELFQRAGADLPAGHVHDAQECRVVIRVHQQTQIGHGVLDLVLGEKRLATGYVIGDLVSLQFHFQQPCLVVAPIENGEVPESQAFLEFLVENFRSHPFGFRVFAAAADDS